MRIRTKLIVMLTPLVIVLLVLLTIYNQVLARKDAWEIANQTAMVIAEDHAAEVQQLLANARGYAEAAAASCEYLQRTGGADRAIIKEYLKDLFQANGNLVGMGMSFVNFDGLNSQYANTTDGNSKGQLGAFWSFVDNKLTYIQLEFEDRPYFLVPQQSKSIYLTEPHPDANTNIPIVAFAVPIKGDRDQVVGVATVDISLDAISKALEEIRPYGSGYALVITDKGLVVGHPVEENVGKHISEVSNRDPKALEEGLRSNERFTIFSVSKMTGEDVMTVFVPFYILENQPPWYYGIVLPVDKVLAKANDQLLESILLALAGIAVAIIVIFLLASSISKPISTMAAFAQKVAGGHYNETVNTQGFSLELFSLNTALKNMISSLLKVMQEAQDSRASAEEGLRSAQAASESAAKAQAEAEEGRQTILHVVEEVDVLVSRLSTATEQLSAQVEQSTISAGEQREMVAGSTNAMEEMNSTVLEVAKNAGVAADGSDKAKSAAEAGENIVSKSIEAISAVQENTKELHHEMDQLGAQAESIGNVMTVISDIADQTNLLALNAAIEAARAGEAGRGFAVVADEVRKLAEKTMDATREVGDAIRGIQNGAQRSIQAVNNTVNNLEQATELVHQSGESLHRIVEESVQVADQVHSIAVAAEEQSASSEEIANSLSHINSSAGETATAMEHSAQAVSELASQTQELQRLMDELRRG